MESHHTFLIQTMNGFIIEINPYSTNKKSATFVAKTQQEIFEILQREIYKEAKIG